MGSRAKFTVVRFITGHLKSPDYQDKDGSEFLCAEEVRQISIPYEITDASRARGPTPSPSGMDRVVGYGAQLLSRKRSALGRQY